MTQQYGKIVSLQSKNEAMLNIKIFTFNLLAVNTYVIFEENGEALVLDPGNGTSEEHQQLAQFIENQQLTVKYIVNTHCHFDHVMGNDFCKQHFQTAPLLMHADGEKLYEHAAGYCNTFSQIAPNMPPADRWLNDGDTLTVGSSELHVISTPGHAAGSICLHDPVGKALFCGDVLFQNSIGRSDLPTGDHNLLISSIKTKLLTLPDDTTVYPGHGGTTSIGIEKISNPYL